ncbi:MAG: group III truncated hemoglobin [Ginsengibacter sp.]
MKKDITTREDIDLLMHDFYKKLLDDNSINYIFTDVAKLDIRAHIPVIADFWESVLFHRNVYHNNAMKIHLDLNNKIPLLKHHFDTWLRYFNTTVDELYEGNIAEMAKQRAVSIATVMQVKIAH